MTDFQQRCEALEAEIDRLRQAFTEDLNNAQMDLVAKNRQIGKLKAELSKVHDDSPENVEIKGLLAFARETLGKTSRWYIGSDGDRAKLARATVKRYGMERAKHTVVALAAKPYAGPRGRSAEPYPGSKRFDDLDHCWGTDKRFTDMEALYAELHKPTLEAVPPPGDEIVRVDGAQMNYTVLEKAKAKRRTEHRHPPIDRVLQALESVGCEWKPYGADQWRSYCPAHDGTNPTSLSIGRNPQGMVLVHCFVGCETDQVLSALNLEWRDLHDDSEFDMQREDAWRDNRGGGRERRSELQDTLRMIEGKLREWDRRAA